MDNLKKSDVEVYNAMVSELDRQRNVIELVASENIVSKAVLEATGSWLTNKYSEGLPNKRYYGGNQFIDVTEQLAIDRAKKLFGAEHANVQPHSGSSANLAAYLAVLKPGDAILGMDLAHGGHLTHGSPVNFSGKLFNFVSYGVDKDSEQVDLKVVEALALKHRPKLILAGFSAYPRFLDFKKFREIADKVNAYLMVDMAHVAGLIAAKVYPDPVPFADIITTTTHKTLRGPRGALILCKTADRLNPSDKKNLAQKMDSAVFPGTQGGPLEHVIAAKAVAFGEALLPSFVDYQKRVVKNAQVLAKVLIDNGFRLVSGGTDNHLILVDVTNKNLSGKIAEHALDKAGICCNKNMIPFDRRSPFDPSGIRLGTPAVTTRGMKESEMELIGAWISEVLQNVNDSVVLSSVRERVLSLCRKFPIYD
ncbi:serine hydroxymethyltransferase [Candidatus Woesearchaeota archaeon]|nr:serine hydroxymethyltransferase [Candidatus Woesearchaeota archaeon]MBW3016616.1 serine hydroxymethyltransferase [Candidatus Woesearchaeota archaeon]